MKRISTRIVKRLSTGAAVVGCLAAFWVAAGAPLLTGI